MARKEQPPPPLPPSFRLRALRDAIGQKKSALAHEWGVSVAALEGWEDGSRKPCADGNPYIIETWSRQAAAKAGRPDLIIRAVDWLSPEARERVRRLAPSFLEASP